jgi:CRISPR/Cas system-associated endoribonuclease Cas2
VTSATNYYSCRASRSQLLLFHDDTPFHQPAGLDARKFVVVTRLCQSTITMAVAALKTDLQSMQHYLFSLEAIMSSSALADAKSHQCQFFKDRIGALGNINPACAAEINKLIVNGPWTQPQQEELCTKLGSMVSVTVTAVRGHRKTQTMQHWNNYMTQPELDKFKDTTFPTSEKLSLVAQRLKTIKLMWGSEASYKNIMVNWLHSSTFEAPLTSEDTYHLLNRLKSMIHQMRKIEGSETSDHIIVYPEFPRQEWFPDAAPLRLIVPRSEYDGIANAMASRTTSSILRPTNPARNGSAAPDQQAIPNQALMNHASSMYTIYTGILFFRVDTVYATSVLFENRVSVNNHKPLNIMRASLALHLPL